MPDLGLDGLTLLTPIPGAAETYIVSAAADYRGNVNDLFVARTLSATVALGIRSSGAAFDLQIASSEVLTANRTLTIVMGDAPRTLTVATIARTDAGQTFTGVNTMTAPTLNQANLVGVTTNSNAAAGSVGEQIEATATLTSVSLVTVTGKTIVSISLTAGDWDVAGAVYHSTAATTQLNYAYVSIGFTNNTLDLTPSRFAAQTFPGIVPGAGELSQAIPKLRISLSATTTVYLVAQDSFSVSTMTAGGYLAARRVR